jgi:hypothetical protein
VSGQTRRERVDRAGRNPRVAVEEQDEVAAGRSNPDIVGGGKPSISILLDHPDGGPARTNCLDAAIRGGVVDYRDLVRHRDRGPVQRLEASSKVCACVETDDDDGEGHREAILSRCSSVREAAVFHE